MASSILLFLHRKLMMRSCDLG